MGVSVGVGIGVSVTVGLIRSAACCDGIVGVTVDGVARLTLPTAVQIQAKNKRTARIIPHPMESFTFFVCDLYHCHNPGCLFGVGKVVKRGRLNGLGAACVVRLYKDGRYGGT